LNQNLNKFRKGGEVLTYSDRDLLVATQIAYYNFDKDTFRGKKGNATLKELLDDPGKIVFNQLKSNLNKAKTPLDISRAQSAIKLYNEIDSGDSKYSNWIIKKVNDDNRNSGFYGCLIETSPDSAIVGFRGSESMEGDQLQKDWINNDLGLLDSKGTDQQKVAESFMNDINSEYKYSNYATTGHSLGGNLSEHATITAPTAMKDKISQCLSFDGPGFSDEYIKDHADQISQVQGKITHYQWSFVGALLSQIPGENYKSIMTKDEVYGKYDIGSLTQKHDTSFVDFYGNVRVMPGVMDNFARSIGKLSREIDSCPSEVGNALIWGINGIIAMPDNEKKLAATAIIVELAMFALTHPITTAVGVVAIAALAVIGYIDSDFYGKTLIPFITGTVSIAIDIGKAVADGVASVVKEILLASNMAADLVNKLVNGVAVAINGLVSWANKTFNEGYKYACANPYIVVNTDKLRIYANRLIAVNRKVANLNRRLDALYSRIGWDALYSEAGLENLLRLFETDVFTEYSWRINQCINYLSETAEAFDNAESRILVQLSKV
jgi:hypothetical protein